MEKSYILFLVRLSTIRWWVLFVIWTYFYEFQWIRYQHGKVKVQKKSINLHIHILYILTNLKKSGKGNF